MGYNIRINSIYFIIGFAIGILYIYVTHEPPRVIWHHNGSISKNNKIVYKDNQNHCYRYLAEEVKCPPDISSMSGNIKNTNSTDAKDIKNDIGISVDHPLIIGT